MSSVPTPASPSRGSFATGASCLAVLAITTLAAACGPAEAAPAGAPQVGHAPAMDSEYKVVTGWPRFPDGVSIGQASALAVNSQGEVILFQRGHAEDENAQGKLDAPTIMVFDPTTGELLRTMGHGLFSNPHGMSVDAEDNIWIADSGQHQVMKLSPEGEVLLTVGVDGVPGEDETHLAGVTDVAVAADGSFYVSDGYGNNRVVKFDAQGNFLFDWGGAPGDGPGEFDLPHGITLDDEGRVYVADRTNSRVQIFEADGTFITEWTHWQGQARGDMGRPWGLEYANGSIYVADGGEYWLTGQYTSNQPDTLPIDMAQIQRFDMDGTLMEAWGEFGPQDGRMVWPHDVTVDHDGAVYSVEVHTGQRIQKWAPGGGNIR